MNVWLIIHGLRSVWDFVSFLPVTFHSAIENTQSRAYIFSAYIFTLRVWLHMLVVCIVICCFCMDLFLLSEFLVLQWHAVNTAKPVLKDHH